MFQGICPVFCVKTRDEPPRKILKEEYTAAVKASTSASATGSEEIAVDFPQNLVEIFVGGLTVDNWVWESYDKDYHCLWESERHEADVQLCQTGCVLLFSHGATCDTRTHTHTHFRPLSEAKLSSSLCGPEDRHCPAGQIPHSWR